jgi:cell wall-associated NlpC family hydrolase
MVHLTEIQFAQTYQCQADLNLYKSPARDSLVTQAAAGRYLSFLEIPSTAMDSALSVRLCEDDYPGWLAIDDLVQVTPATTTYCPPRPSATEIQAAIPAVIRFTQAAMQCPNTYLWGGTVAPNYDCSGLMQAAFASVGIQLPRDSYQQEAFADAIAISALQPGDLIFFGPPERATHVALYLGNGQYIHSSGQDQGRNGIGIDSLQDLSDPISQTYYRQIRGAGRITRSYHPRDTPTICL